MRKDFKSYCEGGGEDGRKQDRQKPQMDENDMLEFAKKYEGKTQGEIMSDILALAGKGRRDGSLNLEQIDAFASVLAPSLNPEQRARLQEVLKLIKNG